MRRTLLAGKSRRSGPDILRELIVKSLVWGLVVVKAVVTALPLPF
jgi:hypothetical protein